LFAWPDQSKLIRLDPCLRNIGVHPWAKAGILVPGQIVEWFVYLDSRKPS
jgi:hypothetical protein